MTIGMSRVLFLGDEGSPLDAALPGRIAQALLGAGLVSGDAAEPRMLQPAGTLRSWCKKLRMRGVDVAVEVHDPPLKLGDLDLPLEGPFSACPECGKVVPTRGIATRNPLTGGILRIPVNRCEECRHPFDVELWPTADGGRIFLARLTVSVDAERFDRNHPSLHDGCPEFVSCVAEVVGSPVSEHLVLC